jgi:hypothetical protein
VEKVNPALGLLGAGKKNSSGDTPAMEAVVPEIHKQLSFE